MARMHRTWGVACVLLWTQGVAVAGVSLEAAQDLAKKSGLWTQLDSLGAQMNAGMADAAAKDPARLSAEQRAKFDACVQSAYAAERLHATAIDAVASTLQPADLAPLAAWYDGETGRKIAATEQASAAQVSDPGERLRRGAEALADAGDTRKASLQAIIAQSHSAEMMADTLIEMALSVQQALANAGTPTPGPRPAELKANLMSKRPQLLAHYAQISLDAFAFTYIDLDNDELKAYADFLASPSGTAINDGSMRGVSRALGAGSVQLGRCLQAGRETKGS